MTRPETPYEEISYELNKFRERRMAERRAVQRDTPDRRRAPSETNGQNGALRFPDGQGGTPGSGIA